MEFGRDELFTETQGPTVEYSHPARRNGGISNMEIEKFNADGARIWAEQKRSGELQRGQKKRKK